MSNTRNNSPSQQPGKVGRLARSRAACEACHRVKQRCDGPSVCPCHRCKTWGIECIFPSSAGPVSSKSTLNKGSSPISSNAASPAASSSTSTVNGKGKAPVRNADSTPPQPSTSTMIMPPELAQQLRVMMARLDSIEQTLAKAQVSFPNNTGSTSHHTNQRNSHSGQTTISDETPHSATHYNEQHNTSTSNPVEAAGEAIEAMAVEGLVGLSDSNHGAHRVGNNWDPTRPDVISKSLMTVQECEAEFQIYFDNLHPWALSLSSTLERDPMIVRARSPLLFHSILLTTIYYRDRTAENMALYQSISSIIDSILAPNILCPQPDQLCSDFIRSIHLLTLYKPLPIATFHSRGIRDLSSIEHASKINVRASWLLRLLASRVAMFIGLPSITTTFARHFANQHLEPIPRSIINEQRLYFGCVFHESHGALQSGKPSNFVASEALKSTRLFAALRDQPADIRLSASVELAAISASVLSTRKEGDLFESEDLEKFEAELQAWESYWNPILSAQSNGGDQNGDELFWTASIPYQAFIRVVVYGYTFARWKNKKKELAKSLLPSPGLNENEFECLKKAVEASQAILLAISNEGKKFVEGKGISVGWEGVGNELTVDMACAEKLKWASDSLTCVLFSYPLIFLAKLANEGLLLSTFNLLPHSTSPKKNPLPTLSPSTKLCQLLKLGADLLSSIAPHPTHPAVKQSLFLRKIREAGINGRTSVISAPTSPRLSSSNRPLLTTNEEMNLNPPKSEGGFNDFLLSSSTTNSWNPSPINGSPKDPFGALLSGIEPNLLFSSSNEMGDDLFGGIDSGFAAVDWDRLDMTGGQNQQIGGAGNHSSTNAGAGMMQMQNGVQGVRSMFSSDF